MPGILADIPCFGRIYECWDCPNIHLQVGPVNISFGRDAYMQLVDLVNSSAANFELLRHKESAGATLLTNHRQAIEEFSTRKSH